MRFLHPICAEALTSVDLAVTTAVPSIMENARGGKFVSSAPLTSPDVARLAFVAIVMKTLGIGSAIIGERTDSARVKYR